MMVMFYPAFSQVSSYGELQSAYLFNFAKYITWPNERQDFTIAIFGKTELSKELENTLREKKVHGLEIKVKEVHSIDDLPECQIIFLPESNSRTLTSLKSAVSGKHVLIVSEEDLIKKGASISFVIYDDRLRFKLNKDSLSDAGLVASDGLLNLAVFQ